MTGSLRRCIVVLSLIIFTYRPSVAQQYQLDTLAASPNIAFPVGIVFSPDNSGKFFFTEKNNGRVRIHTGSSLVATPFVTVGVTGSGEQGLLGITLHPQYPDSAYVYIFFTRSTTAGGTRDNMIVRYTDSSSIGIRPDTIVVVPRNNGAGNHNGGNVHFGPDGKLYATFGEYATTSNSQDSTSTNLRGKILRLNPDGSIPADNPFPGAPFWSIGHRNSFDFTFDALTGKMYCSENGPSCNDEVNYVPRRANMGWPIEGNCTYSNNPTYTRPLYVFPSNLPALTGIAVYRGTAFPRLYGELLFTGNSTPTVWSLTLTANGDTIVPGSFATFFTYSTGFADIEFGPDGNIYLANGPYSASRILRLRPVVPTFTSSAPLAATQDVPYSYTPTFTGTPPGLEIIGGPSGMVVDSTTWSVRWTPTNAQALAGAHLVTVRARNGAGFVDQSFTINVANVNDPPGEFNLLSPPNDTTFSFIGKDPQIGFEWEDAIDPDLDPISYNVQIDTVNTFNSPGLMNIPAGSATIANVVLPRISRTYYWRVQALDGQVTVASANTRRIFVSFVTRVQEDPDMPSQVLEQNFPNPFNPSTSIKYTIPKSGFVRLAVFNLLGQEVALVFEGMQGAGTYEFEFDKADLPTGIYFYRINAPDFAETRKMVITK
ncbi:MAG: PQQ-dependent sugar dehydrogenase [Bacteroidota bacterium]